MPSTENMGRERILQRVQNSLKTPSPPPHDCETAERSDIFPTVSDALERFQKECAGNNTECVITANMGASCAAVRDILAGLPTGEIFAQDAPELRNMSTSWPTSRKVRWSNMGGPAETSHATITLAEFLVAETGSVMVSASCGGRGASVVAPIHIVVAKLSQLLPSLEAGFARLGQQQIAFKNSMLCLITGSSRTADIEKILVLGAHGPRRLVVVLSRAD